MCLKPQPPMPIPPDTKALVGPMLDEATVYRFVGDALFEQFHDEEFADLYPNDGQPALSPVLLAFVCVFQTLEDLSDRATAFNLSFNIAWKYALHLPLSYPGFHPTVLSGFRQRILTHHAEARLFDAIFARLASLGYFTRHGIQHTDSSIILSQHRRMKRIELCVAAIRAAVRNLVHHDPVWARATIPLVWEERYARRCKAEHVTDAQRDALQRQVGADGQWLLDRLEQDDAAQLRDLRDVGTLRDVWAIQYARDADGQLTWVAHPHGGGSTVVETPYDPEALWSTKRRQDWVGYKLQVTETDDDDQPHLLTDIAVTPAPLADVSALPAIRERQQANDTLPGARYVDSGYVSGELIQTGATVYHEDLIGPIRDVATRQTKLPGGFTHADFQIDLAQKQATCPAGATTGIFTTSDVGGWQAIFPAATCRDCPLRARCWMGDGKKSGRSLRFGAYYQDTQAARARQQTDAFKTAYRTHRSGVEGCISVLVRRHGIRTTRYNGLAKTHLRAVLTGAAVNLARTAAWRAGYRPKPYPPTLGLRVAGAPAQATPCA